jgi:hypothetical protein
MKTPSTFASRVNAEKEEPANGSGTGVEDTKTMVLFVAPFALFASARSRWAVI